MPYTGFADAVRAAIADETQAAQLYSELAAMAPNAAFRARIRCIASEERRHARILSSFLQGAAPDTVGPDVWETEGWQDEADEGGTSDVTWGPGPPRPPVPPAPPPGQPAPGPVVPGTFAEGVAMAIEGETGAIREYANLAALAPGPGVRERILCIQKDEMYHKVSFEFMQSIIRAM